MKRKFIILDWAANICFSGIEFDSFDEAEAWLSEKLSDEYETDRGEYYIEEKTKETTREKNYLDPFDPRVKRGNK